MPKDLWITMLVAIIATVIAHQINKSALIETISQKTGKLIRVFIRVIARFGIGFLLMVFCLSKLLDFGLNGDPINRWEILEAVFYALLALEFLKFLIHDLADVSSGKRPL